MYYEHEVPGLILFRPTYDKSTIVYPVCGAVCFASFFAFRVFRSTRAEIASFLHGRRTGVGGMYVVGGFGLVEGAARGGGWGGCTGAEIKD